MTRILHFADIHISEFSTLSGLPLRDKAGLNGAIADTRHAIRETLKVALGSGPLDGIVIGGDLFDRPRPTPSDVQFAAGFLRELAGECKSGKVLVLSGNHDTTRSNKDASAVLSVGLADYVIPVDSNTTISYAGLDWVCVPYPRRAAYTGVDCPPEANSNDFWSKYLCDGVAKMSGQDKVLLFHGTVTGATVGAQPRTLEGDIQLSEGAASGYKAVMLGHIHQRQKIMSSTPIWYPGSPAIQGFGEEGEDKGGILWTFGNEVEFEAITVPGRKWKTFSLGFDDEAAIERASAADRALEDLDPTSGAICRIIGTVSPEVAAAMRLAMREASSRGLFVVDRLELTRAERTTKVAPQVLTGDNMLESALTLRDITGSDSKRVMALHPEVEEAIDL